MPIMKTREETGKPAGQIADEQKSREKAGGLLGEVEARIVEIRAGLGDFAKYAGYPAQGLEKELERIAELASMAKKEIESNPSQAVLYLSRAKFEAEKLVADVYRNVKIAKQELSYVKSFDSWQASLTPEEIKGGKSFFRENEVEYRILLKAAEEVIKTGDFYGSNEGMHAYGKTLGGKKVMVQTTVKGALPKSGAGINIDAENSIGNEFVFYDGGIKATGLERGISRLIDIIGTKPVTDAGVIKELNRRGEQEIAKESYENAKKVWELGDALEGR